VRNHRFRNKFVIPTGAQRSGPAVKRFVRPNQEESQFVPFGLKA